MTVPAYQPQLPLDIPTSSTDNRPAPGTQGGRPGDPAHNAEARMLTTLAARYPRDALVWLDNAQPAVLARLVATGTYGRVSGLDLYGTAVTAEGYVQSAWLVRGGLGGRFRDTPIVVRLADNPRVPTTAIVQTRPDDRFHVLRPPHDDLPGEVAPWLRLPVEHQILAARHLLGLNIEITDGPINPLWLVEGCLHQVTGEVARWLFGGRSGSWDGRARPVFDARHVDHAVAAGRVRPNGQPWPHSRQRPVPPPWSGTGQVPGIEARRREVTTALAQAATYQIIADTVRRTARTEFTTVDGRVVDAGRLAAHLAAAADQTLRDEASQPAGRWCGVQVSFQRADPDTVLVRLSADGVNHIGLPVAYRSIAEVPGVLVAAVTDAVTHAASRAVARSEAANALADYLACARGAPTNPPTRPTSPPAAAAFSGQPRLEHNTAALPAPARTEPAAHEPIRAQRGR